MKAAPLIAVIACAACAGRQPPPPARPAADPSPAVPAVTRQRIDPPPADYDRPIMVCVVRGGGLEMVPIEYHHATGDTTYQGVPFSQAFPLRGGYAAEAEWFVTNEAIRYRPGWPHVKYGYARVLGTDEIVRVGEYRGVGVYAEVGRTEDPQVVYVPVRPGCVFQPYSVNVK